MQGRAGQKVLRVLAVALSYIQLILVRYVYVYVPRAKYEFLRYMGT